VSHEEEQHAGSGGSTPPSHTAVTIPSLESSQPSVSAAPVVHGEWAQAPPLDEDVHVPPTHVSDAEQQVAPHMDAPPAQPHAPFVHCPPLQDIPHDPQFMGSLDVSVQPPGHIVSPDRQPPVVCPAQLPLVHVPLSHTMPQPPQFAALDVVSTQLPPHDDCPPVHPPPESPGGIVPESPVPTMMMPPPPSCSVTPTSPTLPSGPPA